MPLDGATETWWVKVGDKVFGPYSRELMARYIAEGRIAPTSLVATSRDGEWTEARYSPALAAALADARGSFKAERGGDGREANLLVYVDITSGMPRRIEHDMRGLGAVTEVGPGLYLMRTTRTAGVVRNTLSLLLGHGDRLLVMDATRDRLAWFNLGPETDARIREIWNAALKS